MATNFHYDSIKKNPNARIIVTFPAAQSATGGSVQQTNLNEGPTANLSNSGRSVEGIILDKVSIGGGADFNNPLESAAQAALDSTLTNVQMGLRAAAAKAGMNSDSIPVLSLKSVAQSISVWTGSERPSFNIPMMFIATRRDQDIREDVKKLLKTVYPTFSDAGTILPPLGYGSSLGVEGALPTAKNTCTIFIGQWFKASQQIMRSVEFSFSPEVHSNNTPLYAIGSIKFEPFRTVSYEEVSGYISI